MTTFSQYADKWTENVLCLKKPASQITMKSHLKILKQSFGKQPISSINYASTQQLFSQLSQTLAPKTVKNVWGTFRDVLAHAQREGIVSSIIKPVLPKNVHKEQPWLTVEQMNALIAGATNFYERLIYYTLAETGLRIGELLALQTEDIDLENFKITINKSLFNGRLQSPKTNSSFRIISISEKLAEAFRKQLEGREPGFVFRNMHGKPLWANQILVESLHPLMQELKIKRCGFHAFRRGNATLMCTILGTPEKIALGRLGHTGDNITMRSYAFMFEYADRNTANLIASKLVL